MEKNADGIKNIKKYEMTNEELNRAWIEFTGDENCKRFIKALSRLQRNILLRRNGWQYLSTPMIEEVAKLATLNRQIERFKKVTKCKSMN